MKNKLKVHFSSNSAEWETPLDLFLQLNEAFSFTLDVCASEKNAKCRRYFDKSRDALNQKWRGRCWMNPPYGSVIGEWIRKAWESAQEGALVVCLLPARTDTRYWQDYCTKAILRFFAGVCDLAERNRGPLFLRP